MRHPPFICFAVLGIATAALGGIIIKTESYNPTAPVVNEVVLRRHILDDGGIRTSVHVDMCAVTSDGGLGGCGGVSFLAPAALMTAVRLELVARDAGTASQWRRALGYETP